MRKLSLLSGFIFLIFLLMSCGQKLTENLAMESIRKAKGYPKLVSTTLIDVEPNSPIGQEISRLVEERYMLPQKSYWTGFEITEKGKNIVSKCVWNSFYQYYEVCTFFTHKEDISKIKKILTDSKAGSMSL
ncbi:MAG: hypothetical protein L6246_09615 [Thermodesulfovibrionales bacterium]|nr:hypothetical protein [Nitrospinota bacterium]MCG2710553.1 hypothetical protein [Thermodesulfovibrionales bacterium]